ncbi:hypothetical protein ACFOZ7_11845 [Natribaculum luteum]|uniref:MarR family transcriptional regulator n=1 Tax=Natribaculum luteum TaxID=1586232 RepID=A0ABD5P0Q3_9EURY|nr:hypothetical protein [Natribaculum luteum]
MQTETWIERTIIDQLTTHDRRYKHDYGGVEKTTDDLVAACVKHDLITSEDEPELPSLDQFFAADVDLEPAVESALQTLVERGLIERVGERERLGPPLEPGDYGTTDLWKPTVEGRAEASAIREAYSTEVEALAESHGTESDEFKEQIVTLARTYGILPNYFG